MTGSRPVIFFLISMSKNKNTAGEDLFLVSSSASSNLLQEGRYTVTIESIVGAEVKHDTVKDPTPQAKMVMRGDNNAQMTDWLNLAGYKQMDDLTDEEIDSGDYTGVVIGDREYAVNAKTGKRVKDKKRTDAALGIIAQVGYASGIKEGEPVNPHVLVGRKVGIQVVRNAQGNLRVKAYFNPNKSAAAAPAATRKATRS